MRPPALDLLDCFNSLSNKQTTEYIYSKKKKEEERRKKLDLTITGYIGSSSDMYLKDPP
jgi:hypothetical protein